MGSLPDVHAYTFASIHIHPFIINNIHAWIRLIYRSPKSLQHLTLSEKHERRRAYSSWCSFLRRVGVSEDKRGSPHQPLEQTLRNVSGKGPSNWPIHQPKSYKTKSFDGIDQDKMMVLEARIRVIEGVNLYELVQATKMSMVPNVVVLKKFLCSWIHQIH
jgi:hypothetical protein